MLTLNVNFFKKTGKELKITAKKCFWGSNSRWIWKKGLWKWNFEWVSSNSSRYPQLCAKCYNCFFSMDRNSAHKFWLISLMFAETAEPLFELTAFLLKAGLLWYHPFPIYLPQNIIHKEWNVVSRFTWRSDGPFLFKWAVHGQNKLQSEWDFMLIFKHLALWDYNN